MKQYSQELCISSISRCNITKSCVYLQIRDVSQRDFSRDHQIDKITYSILLILKYTKTALSLYKLSFEGIEPVYHYSLTTEFYSICKIKYI